MIPYVKLEEVITKEGPKLGYMLLGEEQGCVNGACCGVSIYTEAAYGPSAAHDDQEGFYVLEGRGVARIDGEELMLEPGMSFMIPAGIDHVMRAAEGSDCCKVFWFHAAIFAQ